MHASQPESVDALNPEFMTRVGAYAALAAALGSGGVAHAGIVVNSGSPTPPFTPNRFSDLVDIDVNGDSSFEFTLDNTFTSFTISFTYTGATTPTTTYYTVTNTYRYGSASLQSIGSGVLLVATTAGNAPRPMAAGELISAGNATNSGAYGALTVSETGPWDTGQRNFVGFSFLIGAERHFGWMALEITDLGNYEIAGYAYEDQPGVPIEAGAVPTPTAAIGGLGLLAAGAAGVRRRRAARREDPVKA